MIDTAAHATTTPPEPWWIALISAITLAELAVGPLVATDETERARRLG